MDLKISSIEQIIEQINKWNTNNKEVFNYFLWRIKKYDTILNSFNYINEKWLNNNSNNTILNWIPIWIKDNFCEKWIITSAASKMLSNFKSPYTASVIERLNQNWMSSIGKVNMDEFAMWSTSESSAIKTSINPWWTNRIPWWSSWWWAVAVAAWLIPASIWTDTWWSIRQPASMCWIVWFKPSYWRNSRYWLIAMASSLDCPWTLTRTVKDSWILYEIMNWEDTKDNTSIRWKDILNPKIWEEKDLKWIKVGVPKEYFEEWLEKWVKDKIKQAIEKLRELGAEIIDISLNMTKYAISTYYILMPAEVSTNLSKLDWIRFWYKSQKKYDSIQDLYINNRWEWFGDEVKRRIIIWSYVLSAWYYDAYYKKAAKVRKLIIDDFKNAFEKVDVIVWPVSPSVAWKIWEKINNPLKMYLSDIYTIPASLAWLPCISIPSWFTQSEDKEKEVLPLWLHMITKYLDEEKLFKIAHIYEQYTKKENYIFPNKYN